MLLKNIIDTLENAGFERNRDIPWPEIVSRFGNFPINYDLISEEGLNFLIYGCIKGKGFFKYWDVCWRYHHFNGYEESEIFFLLCNLAEYCLSLECLEHKIIDSLMCGCSFDYVEGYIDGKGKTGDCRYYPWLISKWDEFLIEGEKYY